jgi:hypothetical protein
MSTIDEAVALGLGQGGILAPLAMLLASTAGYVGFRISAHRIAFNFQLRSLESVELDRSLLLYRKVADRLCEIHQRIAEVQGALLVRYQRRKLLKEAFADELDELETYALHLRSTIVRLRRKPIQRLRAWLHAYSTQLALGRSLMVYFIVCSVAVIELCCLQQLLFLDEAQPKLDLLPPWDRLRDPLLYANWLAAGFMLVTVPLVYLYRRAGLHRKYRAELRSYKRFGAADPDRLIAQLCVEEESCEPLQPYEEPRQEGTCFAVLGVTASATAEEVKEAYRLRVKQTHPDRVQGMSAIFRELAEAETKKLNAAYEEALGTLQAA